MKDLMKITHAYTHGSIFHADDLFATALLLTINPEIQICRTNDVEFAHKAEEDDCAISYDIGYGPYDHHQPDKATRPIENGYWFDKDGRMQLVPYCSFGLLWRDYGHILCPNEKAWKKVDTSLVVPIDKHDNGVERNMLTTAFMQFNPNWNEDDSPERRDRLFMDAVWRAQDFLRAYIAAANAEVASEDAVLASNIVNGNILVLEKYMPWQDVVMEKMQDILFVVFPSARGGWNVQTVPDAPGSFKGRKLFPQEWCGHPVGSLGMTFCHPGNFLLATCTKEQAINCAILAANA